MTDNSIDSKGRAYSPALHAYSPVLRRMVRLTKPMWRLVQALNTYGYVDPIRDGGTTGTIVALMDRGILRGAKGHRGRSYPATTPEMVEKEAYDENDRRTSEADGGWGQPEGMLVDEHDATVGRALIEQAAAAQGIDLEPAPLPTFGQTVYFRHDGRTVSGEVRSTRTGGNLPDAVVVFSTDLGHTHRIDHGIAVNVADLLPAPDERYVVHDQPVCGAPLDGGQRCGRGPACDGKPHIADRRVVRGEVCGPADVLPTRATVKRKSGTVNAGSPTRYREPAPAPTLADDVAALREEIEWLWIGRDGVDLAALRARLDRIAVAVPQQATDYSGTPLWQHSCQTALAQQGAVRPALCHNCDKTGQWQPLYVMSAGA